MNIKNILNSAYDFKDDEYELKLKYILFNSLLIFNILIVSIATFVRLANLQYLNAIVDIIYVTLGLISFFLARRSKEHFSALVYFVIFFSYSIVTLAFSAGLNHIAGLSWYVILLMTVFFLKGTKEGMIIFILSLISIIIVTSALLEYSVTEIALGIIPFFGTLMFMYFFEQRNKNLKELLEAQKEDYAHQAQHDDLTSIANRALFLDRLSHVLKLAKRSNSKVAIIFIDLDRFKEINDSLGHYVGDMVLKEVAQRLQSQIRESDTVARLGGDEFAVIIDTFSSINILNTIVKKLINSMNEVFIIDDNELQVTLSLGITIYPDDGTTVELLLKNADAAMYRAKADGKDRYTFYDKGR